ncbi:hypothetical protein HYI04_10660 [Acinetobacter sp. SwsAc2]|uniref:hypothetical protein n=1 Tax=Acinetobacter sp. SwsAc2 TaxID=2749360 RepID=UPI0015C12140|nr:hypothetical protein [Acinetobacter sp. SwsAc2]NWK59841.1 hypothetical protein [Acinetobacter sp. SwsAc2]
MEFTISLSDILTFITGLLTGSGITYTSQKFISKNSNSNKVVQKRNNVNGKMVGRDDNSVN